MHATHVLYILSSPARDHVTTSFPQEFAVQLPRKLIDDLKATAGGIAATWWILAAMGRYGKSDGSRSWIPSGNLT